MAPKSAPQTPKVGSLIELDVYCDKSRAGSVFLIIKKGRSKRCMWAKLLGCKLPSIGKAWQAEGLPDIPVQLEFGASADQAADRLPGKHEYVKTFSFFVVPA